MEQLKVFYTGMFRFPDIDAAGKRVHKIIDMLNNIDQCKSIIVGGWEQGSESVTKINDKISYRSFSILDKKKRSKISKLFNFLFMGMPVIPWMIFNKDKYSHVFIYNTPFLFSLTVFLLSKFLNKKVILDSTEWYESEHLVGGKYGAASFENWCRMYLAYPLFTNVIAISTFLEKFYSRKGKNIIRLPPLNGEFQGPNIKQQSTDSLSLLYAGSPGQKDRLDNFIEELLKSEKAMNAVKFYIAGISKEKFLSLYPEYYKKEYEIDKVCIFLGRLEMKEIFKLYKQIDYCVFFRENKRYAIAGFPSKYVEAISFGVPVITNSVGDISSELQFTGISYQPKEDDVDNLIEEAIEKKHQYTEVLKKIFEEKYSINANLKHFKEFIERIQ
ncbi:lipopolysaccharide biosynthesis protein RfbU [Cronobacter sakazakii]|uniref:glycosyltransferase n=1 Tax=Cronobacter sakazakii TaxID=28141 RepID=UPI000B3E09A2|nr:glycosyltransferase [Cronobacter sakazakii]PUW94442.1 lipopolysaccharide biosynthesis protein RfbU [Cronobacter sakazakii]